MLFELLAPVKDSVALSDRDSAVFFDVARNGEVTRWSEYAYWTGQPEVLYRLEGRDLAFRWRNGWLPILQVGDRYELFASGDRLLLRDGEKTFSFPEAEPIGRAEFDRQAAKVTAYWENWFAAGLVLPETGTALDHAWKSSLIQALCAFTARHPHYGAHTYRTRNHDAFPPNLLSMTETLLQFGHEAEAEAIYFYYLERFLDAGGTIAYYGPSLSEYGGVLWLTAMLIRRRPECRAPALTAMRSKPRRRCEASSFLNLTYSWTTSSPSRLPVFFSLKRTT